MISANHTEKLNLSYINLFIYKYFILLLTHRKLLIGNPGNKKLLPLDSLIN